MIVLVNGMPVGLICAAHCHLMYLSSYCTSLIDTLKGNQAYNKRHYKLTFLTLLSAMDTHLIIPTLRAARQILLPEALENCHLKTLPVE